MKFIKFVFLVAGSPVIRLRMSFKQIHDRALHNWFENKSSVNVKDLILYDIRKANTTQKERTEENKNTISFHLFLEFSCLLISKEKVEHLSSELIFGEQGKNTKPSDFVIL